jgi:hypothetical protein
LLTANFQLNGRCNQGIIGVYAMRRPGRPLNLRNCAQLLNYRDLGVLDLTRYYLGCNETTEKESEWILKCGKLQRGGQSLEILIFGASQRHQGVYKQTHVARCSVDNNKYLECC